MRLPSKKEDTWLYRSEAECQKYNGHDSDTTIPAHRTTSRESNFSEGKVLDVTPFKELSTATTASDRDSVTIDNLSYHTSYPSEGLVHYEDVLVTKDAVSKQEVKNNTTEAHTGEVSENGDTLLGAVTSTSPIEVIPCKDSPRDKGRLNEGKLVHSHQIPDSILTRFAQCVPAPSAGNLKLFKADYAGTVLESELGKVYAPKQMSRDMFCRKCKDILSSNGETQFIPLFFDRIYDPSDPQKHQREQYIEYSNWLYLFCVGLIFRNISWYDNMFLNEDEIYKLLVQCRKCILNPNSLDQLPASDCPKIFMLMTPLSVEEEELKHGLMNRTLSGTLEWYLG